MYMYIYMYTTFFALYSLLLFFLSISENGALCTSLFIYTSGKHNLSPHPHTHSNTHTSVSTSERMFQDARYHTVKRFLFLFLVLCAFDADDDSTWEFCKFSAEGRVGDKSSGAIDRRPVLVFVLFPTRYAIAPLAG